MATKLEESRAAAPRRTLQQPTRGRHNDPSPSLPYITGDRPRRERQLWQDQQQRLEEGELQGLLGHHPARDRDGNKAGGAGPRSVAERQSASHPGRRSAGGSCCRFAAQEINTEKNVISGTLPASLALLSKLKARAPRGETPTQRRPRRRPLTSRLLAAAQTLRWVHLWHGGRSLTHHVPTSGTHHQTRHRRASCRQSPPRPLPLIRAGPGREPTSVPIQPWT